MEDILTEGGPMPVIALRGMTAFPNQTIYFDVAREISI